MSEIILNESNFESEVLNSDIPVLVDFWAAWCGPCRMIAPVIAELAAENDGRVKVGKVNVDEQPSLAMRYHVASIPTVIVFRGGRAADTSVGVRPKSVFEAMIR